MDIVAEVCLDHIPSDNQTHWQPDDIVAVYDAEQIGSKSGQSYTPHNLPVPLKKNGWLFITNIPDVAGLTLSDLNAIIANSEYNFLFNPPVYTKKRRWQLDRLALSVQQRNNLLTDRYITRSFAQIKSMFKHKGENRYLLDSDLGL
jgi:hypothetical protein